MQYLKFFVLEKKPIFIFLIETLYILNKIDEIKEKLGYDSFLSVDCIGGGLVLLWKDVDSVIPLNICSRCIDVEVSISQIGSWRLTGFYG